MFNVYIYMHFPLFPFDFSPCVLLPCLIIQMQHFGSEKEPTPFFCSFPDKYLFIRMMECNIVLHAGHHVQHGGSDGDSRVLGDHDESGREMKS